MRDMTAPPSTTLAQDPMGIRKLCYTVAILCVSPILVWQLQNPDFSSSMRLIFLGTLLLGLIRWSAAILLVLIQLDLYLTGSVFGDSREPPGLIIAFFCVVLLMILSRLRSSQELTGIRTIAQLLSASAKKLLQPAERTSATQDEEAQTAWGPELLSIASRALILVLGAGILLVMFPVDRSSVEKIGLAPDSLRSLSIGLVLFTGYFALTLVLSEIRWKQMTPDQAGIYLRSRFLGWLHRDLRAFQRRRRRLQRKQARHLWRAGHNTFSQYSEKAD